MRHREYNLDMGNAYMRSVTKAQPYRLRNRKRVLIGETLEEEAARLEKEIAAHPVTRCKAGADIPSTSRPGWSSKPIIPISERLIAEEIGKKMKGKTRER